MTRRAAVGSLPLAAVLLAVFAGPVLAECTPYAEPFPHMRYAFTATVTEFAYGTDDTTPDREWEVELEVERAFRGDLPMILTATGNEVGCDFNGIEVRSGERLLIAAEDVDTGDPWLIRGEIFLWREVADGRWEFYADALQDGALGYPTAVVRAQTTHQILAAIGGFRTPETANAPTHPGPAHTATPAVLAAVFAVVFLAGLGRLRRSGMSSDPRSQRIDG